MAATRDQTARAIRPEAETAEGDASGHAPSAQVSSGQVSSGQVSSGHGEQLRHHVTDEPRRLPADPPNVAPATRPAGAPVASPGADAPKSGKRKFVAIGIIGLLALAAASYAVY